MKEIEVTYITVMEVIDMDKEHHEHVKPFFKLGYEITFESVTPCLLWESHGQNQENYWAVTWKALKVEE